VGLKRFSDLFVAVLFALVIHGAVASLHIPEPRIEAPVQQEMDRPLTVRFVSVKSESTKKEISPAVESPVEPIIKTEAPRTELPPVASDISVPVARRVPIQKKRELLKPPAGERKKVKSAVKAPEKVVKVLPAHAEETPAVATGIRKDSPDMESAVESEGNSFLEPVRTTPTASPNIVKAVPRYKVNPYPRYPAIARRRGYEGVVILSVLVCADGSVSDVKIAESSGRGILDRAAIKSVEKWRFEPATRDGIPVDMEVDVPVRFILKEKRSG